METIDKLLIYLAKLCHTSGTNQLNLDIPTNIQHPVSSVLIKLSKDPWLEKLLLDQGNQMRIILYLLASNCQQDIGKTTQQGLSASPGELDLLLQQALDPGDVVQAGETGQ